MPLGVLCLAECPPQNATPSMRFSGAVGLVDPPQDRQPAVIMIPVLFPLLFGYILSLPDCPQKCLCTPSLMDCRSASLYEVPHGIAQKTETLILNDNHLTLISPEVFQHLLNLTFLGLANNKLSLQNDSFDNIGKSILSLDLSGNNFTDLPLSLLDSTIFIFDPIPNLKILVLSHNEISHLPEGLFDNLKSLNDLLLDYNNFTEISHAIFTTLHNLEHFSVSKNRIQTIPPLLFASRFTLRKLDLSSNLLSELPSDFPSGLEQLEVLNLSANCIGNVPKNLFINNTKLEFLHLDKTCLHTPPIFSGLQNLIELTVCCNGIKILPKTFTDNMANLELLDLSMNDIREIEDDAFEMNHNITKVILTGNPICTTEQFMHYSFKGLDCSSKI
uniref:LRRNT domain-containing protein n=1 Tax=Gopherus evgoodei TaxID=1825980 RepID=A0A8C4XZ06_9SAUR